MLNTWPQNNSTWYLFSRLLRLVWTASCRFVSSGFGASRKPRMYSSAACADVKTKIELAQTFNVDFDGSFLTFWIIFLRCFCFSLFFKLAIWTWTQNTKHRLSNMRIQQIRMLLQIKQNRCLLNKVKSSPGCDSETPQEKIVKRDVHWKNVQKSDSTVKNTMIQFKTAPAQKFFRKRPNHHFHWRKQQHPDSVCSAD